MSKPILPGATLGVLGSGQLGRMFAIEARRLGYRVHVYSPDESTPAGQVCDREWCGSYDDMDLLTEFGRSVDVVTLEFENVSRKALEHLERLAPVRPGPRVLAASQHRLTEKETLRSFGLPTAPFARIESLEQLQAALENVGNRGVLKTASWGYDGKGQRMLRPGVDLAEVWQELGEQELILEGLVDFVHELSVIAVRHPQGDVRCYDPILNVHRHHILDVSSVPSPEISAEVRKEAREIARVVMTSLEVVGVLCVEMFLTPESRLLINEIAPRPHNSGHLTIDAHYCCQFQQQVRAICGLPLGSTELRQPAAMANLLGDVWSNGEPKWECALGRPDVRLHLYGKTEPRPGRKMGHLTCLATEAADAVESVLSVRSSLVPRV